MESRVPAPSHKKAGEVQKTMVDKLHLVEIVRSIHSSPTVS